MKKYNSKFCKKHNQYFEVPGEHWYLGQYRGHAPYFKCKEASLEQSHKWMSNNKASWKKLMAESKTRYLKSAKGRYSTLVRSAKVSNYPISITLEEYTSLWNKPCEYCGDPEISAKGYRLDRKCNSLGYSLDNVVPCCYKCNVTKHKFLTYEEMKVAMKAVLELRKLTKKPNKGIVSK